MKRIQPLIYDFALLAAVSGLPPGLELRGAPLWSYDAGNIIVSSPALAPDGTVYVGAVGGIYAITNYGSYGSNKWVFATGGGQQGSPAVGSDGTIYIASSGTPGYLFAVNPDGSEKWRYLTQGGNGSPGIGFDGTLYIQGYHVFSAVSPTGKMTWTNFNGSETTFGSPSIGSDGTIYIPSPDTGGFRALNPDGTLKWSTPAAVGQGAAPAIGSNGTVYLSGSGLFAYSSKGASLWSHQAALYTSPVVGKDGTIYVAASEYFGLSYGLGLYAFSPSGDSKWQFGTNLNGGLNLSVGTPAIDAAGLLYISAFNTLFAITPAGGVQSAFSPGDGTYSSTSPLIGPDGTIYVTFGSRLYAIAGTNTLGATPWPMFHQNARHTGRVEKALLKQPQKRSDANFQFELYGQVGQSYTIQSSTNLNTWTSLTSIVATTLPTDVVDLSASNSPTRFYRASSPP